MKMEQTECSETSAYKIQTPRNYPEKSIQHSEHGESLKSMINMTYFLLYDFKKFWCQLPEYGEVIKQKHLGAMYKTVLINYVIVHL
jgi:hypothetical protein